jgi:methyl-accepting chemotaxis protein
MRGKTVLKQFKISTKIFSGFSVVILLLLVTAGAGVTGLMIANNDFGEYRHLARGTNLAGRLQANMLLTRINVKDFIINQSERSVDGVRKRAEATLALVPEALEQATDDRAQTAIAAIETQN